jgi:hypothetical protein
MNQFSVSLAAERLRLFGESFLLSVFMYVCEPALKIPVYKFIRNVAGVFYSSVSVFAVPLIEVSDVTRAVLTLWRTIADAEFSPEEVCDQLVFTAAPHLALVIVATLVAASGTLEQPRAVGCMGLHVCRSCACLFVHGDWSGCSSDAVGHSVASGCT